MCTQIRGRFSKVRMIKCVEECAAQLKCQSLMNGKCSLNRHIPCVKSRCDDRVACGISKGPRRFRYERAGLDVGLREILQLIVDWSYAIRTLVKIIGTASSVCTQQRCSQTVTESSCPSKLPIS